MVYIEQIDKFTIKIGRNQNENDKLIKEGSQNDLWFHLKENPSPHGFIHSDTNEEPSKEVIYRTAELVKQYSKFKSYSKVTIIYIELKHIKCTNVPGTVIIKKKTKEIII
jgi:predicted ribosome quality control (RQC) complex YloA/Tae2 family protein